MPAELSELALEGSGVGLLTGTKSIVGGIAIATMPILAQYLMENADQLYEISARLDGTGPARSTVSGTLKWQLQ